MTLGRFLTRLRGHWPFIPKVPMCRHAKDHEWYVAEKGHVISFGFTEFERTVYHCRHCTDYRYTYEYKAT